MSNKIKLSDTKLSFGASNFHKMASHIQYSTEYYDRHCEQVLRVVANYFDLAIRDMLAPTRRQKSIAYARQIAMYLSHTYYGVSMTKIGKFYGRDRTTVGFACRKIEDRRDEPKIDTIISCFEMLLANSNSSNLDITTTRIDDPHMVQYV